MPNTTYTVLVLIGGVVLVIGIFGGGVEINDIRLPRMVSWQRAISVLTGLLLIALGLYLDPQIRPVLVPASSTIQPSSDNRTTVPNTAIEVTQIPSQPTAQIDPTITQSTRSENEVPSTPDEAANKWGGSPSWWKQIEVNGWTLNAAIALSIGKDWRIDFTRPDGQIYSCASTQNPGIYGPATVEVQVATLWYVPGEEKCPPFTIWGKANP